MCNLALGDDFMPLAIAESGIGFTIKRISGNEEIKHHLGNLGFVIGAYVMVVNKMGGNIIVAVKDSRIAISHSMATKIYV